jgi:formyl-CoA transferase
LTSVHEPDAQGSSTGAPALSSVKIVEFAQFVAAPLAGTLLADLGAEVVHIEDPVLGDTSRSLGSARDGIRFGWKMTGRNKRSVTIDLRKPEGQELARDLVRWADVAITNFRFETLESWGLDWKTMHQVNPRLIMLQVSGFGASSSRRNEPGFGKLGEARSGVLYNTTAPDGTPVLPGFPLGDSTTALMGAFAVSAALVRSREPGFAGEWIDLALFETLFRLSEWQIITYDQLGNVDASESPALVGVYRSADRVWIVITSGSIRSVQNIAEMVGESADDYGTAHAQRTNKPRLDQLVREWIGSRDAEEVLGEMAKRSVVGSRIYSAADIVADPVYTELKDVITIDDPEIGPVRMQGVVPRFHVNPGKVWRTGPGLGADNELVYGSYLGRTPEELEHLKAQGII